MMSQENEPRSRNTTSVPSVAQEFEKIDLGDPRLDRRVKQIVARCAEAPDHSFPELMSSRSELELTYRLLGNERVSPPELLRPHLTETVTRVEAAKTALIVHDTSEMSFPGDELREGLSWFSKERQGFLFHAALAVSADGLRRPLGVIGALPWVREVGGKKSGPEFEAKKESLRWFKLVEEVQQRVDAVADLIHLMDREGDAYELLASMVKGCHRFVVRMCHDREVLGEEGAEQLRVRAALGQAELHLERDVKVSKRGSKKRGPPRAVQKFGPREKRTAHVSIKAMPLIIKRSSECRRKDLPDSISVNVIHVIELSPPAGAEPVEWLLMTTEPITTKEDVERLVDYYRARWTIEEFFKALKTGCAYESRQLTSYDALLRALMIFLPLAWRVLLLRTVARVSPDTEASTVLSKTEIAVLRTRTKLPPMPSARDALLAVARLGGHLSNNGDPGWLVLARGMEKLVLLSAGWDASEQAASRGSIG